MNKKETNKKVLEQFERMNFTINRIDKFFENIRHNKVIIENSMEQFVKQNVRKFINIIGFLIDAHYPFEFTLNISRTKIKNTFKILVECWQEDDKDLFMINWFVFMADWQEMVNAFYDLFDNEKINRIYLN